MSNGKDRAKHDGGKDASGRVRDGAEHPESPSNTTFQPESGMPPKDQDEQRRRQERTIDDDD